MKKLGFAERLEATLADARELSGLWTGTAIADKIDIEIDSLLNGVENGEAEEVTYELLPRLKETLKYADEELQRVEG